MEKRISEVVSGNIAAYRKAKGMTQSKLGELIGLSRTSIVNIEKGRRPLQIDTIWEIANQLDIPPLWLLWSHDLNVHGYDLLPSKVKKILYKMVGDD